MTKKDMVALIKAYEAWEAMNAMLQKMTDGYRIENEKFTPLDGIFDVIQRNSKFSSESDKDEKELEGILDSMTISAEEKCENSKKHTNRLF